MSSAATSGKYDRWGGSGSSRESAAVDLANLSTSRHNGGVSHVEPETGTGCWNWWEIANARIVGEACDRFLRARYEKTRDRLISPLEYNRALRTKEINLAVAAKRERAKLESEGIVPVASSGEGHE